MHRESNIELLRIIAMLMIVLLHMNYFSLGEVHFEEIQATPYSSFWRIFAEQLCIIGVDVFVMISGWFGIKPHIKGVCTLLFQVLFWGIVIFICGVFCGLNISIKPMARVLWFGSYYWFIISYIGLYILAPVLNSFITRSSKKEYLTVLICFFLAEFIYGWLVDSKDFNNGYSIISFIGMYLLARYIRLYSTDLKRLSPSTCLFLYFFLTLIPSVISYVGIKYNGIQLHPLYYN